MTAHRPKPIWDRFLTADAILRLLFVLVFAAFLQTLTFELVYDDFTLTTLNPWLQSASGLNQMFTHHSWAFADGYLPARHYRPMYLLWLWCVQNIFGPSPSWFHLWAILTHLVACFLAYRLAIRLLGGDRIYAALVALLFAIHPTKAEIVGWIAASTESLLAVFLLGGFLAYLNAREKSRGAYLWMFASLICFAGALLTKETAVLLPLLIVLYELFLGPSAGGRLRIPRLASFLALMALTLAAFVFVRAVVLKGVGDSAIPATFTTVIFTTPIAFCLLIRQLIWPFGLSALYPHVVVTHFSWKYFFFPALALLLLAVAYSFWARRSALLKFAGAWFVILLIPVVVEFNWIQLHDRHLYLPSFGAAIMVVMLVQQIKWPEHFDQQRARISSLVVLALVLAAVSAHEVRLWRSSVAVFSRAVEIAPTNLEAIEMLAETYYSTGDPEQAFVVLKHGLSISPNSTRLTYAMAHDLYQSGRYDEAKVYYEKVLALGFDPVVRPSAHFELGMIEWKSGDLSAAESQISRAAELAPNVKGYQSALARLQSASLRQTSNTK